MNMKRIHLTICLALLSLLTASCGKEEPFAPAGNATPVELRVVADNFVSTHEATRASDAGYVTTFTANDQIGIFAVKTSDGLVLHKNIPYKYNGSAWVPVDDANTVYHYNYLDDVTYFAYYPYSVDMDDAASEDDIVAKFTPQADQSTYANYTKSDLMTGTGTVSLIDGKSVLTFQLAHRMSLLVIYPRGQHYQTSDGYDFYAPPKDITTLEVGSITSVYQPGDCTFRAIVPPGAVNVTISYVTTEDVTLQYTGTASTTAGKFSKMVLTPASPALPYSISVGDYFFFDGGLLPTAVALAEVNKKNCIGLVFKVGRFPADDSEYVNGSGAVMNTINGYVVALKDANNGGGAAWGNKTFSGLESNRTTSCPVGFFDGFKITQLLKADGISNYPAANACVNYSPAADIKTSGWFFPAGGQIVELRNTRGSLEAKANFTNYNTNRYWQSTQNGGGIHGAWVWQIHAVYNPLKKQTISYVRF